MVTRFNVQEYLNALREARDEAFSEGDWDRVDQLQLCIDDTENQLYVINLLEETR